MMKCFDSKTCWHSLLAGLALYSNKQLTNADIDTLHAKHTICQRHMAVLTAEIDCS